MRHLLALFLFVACLSVPMAMLADASSEAASYDALVVLQVADLNDDLVARLAAQVGRDKSAYLEYSCTRSGLLVLKFSEISVSERADVIMLAKRLLSSAGIERGIEILHVHVAQGGLGKC